MSGFTVRLCLVFLLECIIVIAGFAIVITLTLLNEDKLISSDVHSMIDAKMASNQDKIMIPLRTREDQLRRTIVTLQSRNLSCRYISMHNESAEEFAQHIPTWMHYHTSLKYDAFAAFLYEDWLVEGATDPNNPGVPVWQECGCEALVPRCGRYWNLTRYAFQAGPAATDYGSLTIVGRKSPANPGGASYVNVSIRTIPMGNTEGRWPAPYTWPVLAPSGRMVITALYSYYRCLDWNATTGDCIHSLGIDLSLDSITQFISTLATTPSSTVALVDRTSGVLLAHNGEFAQFGSDNNAFPAEATPSHTINTLVRQFNQECTGTCTRVIEIGEDTVTASYAFQSTSGLNLLLLDITPRRHYYGLFDDNRRIGIIVAAVVPFVVVLVCILVVIAVSKPLEEIAEMMVSAASMRPESVAKPSRWMFLTEIMQLHQSYQTMHAKLLELKPYVPSALFVRTDHFERSGQSMSSDEALVTDDAAPPKKRGKLPSITITSNSVNIPIPGDEQNPLSTRSDGDDGANAVPLQPPSRSTSWMKFGSSVTTMNSSLTDGGNSYTAPHRVMLGNLGGEVNVFRRVNCSVLYIRVEYDYGGDTELVGHDVASVMESVLQLVGEAGGVLEVHRPEALVVSFGAQNSLATHHKEATMSALHILRRMRRRRNTPAVSIIVDTAEYYVGTCGTSSRLSRVIFGDRVPLILLMHRLAMQVLKSPLLVTEKTAMSLSGANFVLIPVDAVLPSFALPKPMLESDNRPPSQLTASAYSAIKLYEVVDNRKKKYTAEDFNQLGINEYKTAFSALIRGEHASAISGLQSVVKMIEANKGTRSRLGAMMLRNVLRLTSAASAAGAASEAPYQRRQLFPFELIGSEVVESKKTLPSRLFKPPMQVEDLSGHPRSVNDLSQVVPITVGRQRASDSSTDSDVEVNTIESRGAPTPMITPRPLLPKEEPKDIKAESDKDGGGLFEMFGVEDHTANLDDHPNGGIAGELPTLFEDTQGVSWNRSKEVLGSGAFSTVYKGLSSSGMVVALKCIDLNHRHINAHDLVSEVNLACSLRHENIVNHFGWARSDRYLAIAMELIVGGSLMNILESFGPFSFATFRRYACDALNGLAFLHSRGIVHADVKPHNMLVATDGSCKLGDFGSSIGLGGSIGPDVTADVFGIRGTAMYMSAETADGIEPSFASDVWALGISFYQLLTGRLPWQYSPSYKTSQALGALMRNDALFMQAVGRKDVIAVVSEVDITDPLVFEFLCLCLKPNPSERASASLLLQDRLFM